MMGMSTGITVAKLGKITMYIVTDTVSLSQVAMAVPILVYPTREPPS